MNKSVEEAQKIYIDANIVIYFLEGENENQERATALFRYAAENEIPLMTSEITIAECLYGVYRSGRDALKEDYTQLFYGVAPFHFIPVERRIAERSAEVGAKLKLKLIDAIHFESALEVGCDVFVTNDKGIKSTDSLKVVQLSDL